MFDGGSSLTEWKPTRKAKQSMDSKWTFGILIVVLCGAPAFGADLSANGGHKTSQLEFPGLVDRARGNRKTPLKVHLPDGTGPFPVVIVSHGAGGNWNANFAQARHLASHGIAAICVEHVGSNTSVAIKGGARVGKTIAAMTRDSEEVLNRPKDVRFAIDQVIRWNQVHDELRGRFDIQRIGVLGHSFGAFTTMVVCGARPALDWMKPPVGVGKGLGPDLHDERVRCGVALSPQGPGDPFFLPESYQSIRVPLLGISGSRDKQQNYAPIHRKQSFELWPKGDRYFLWISNASHLSFSDSTGSRQRRTNSQPNRMSIRREDVQQLSRAATLLFFEKYLLKTDDVRFQEKALEPYTGGIAEDIELLVR